MKIKWFIQIEIIVHIKFDLRPTLKKTGICISAWNESSACMILFPVIVLLFMSYTCNILTT